MSSIRGDYHRIPYTKEETSDLLLALDVEILDQKEMILELNEKELIEFQTSIPELYKETAEKEFQDESKDRHSTFLDVFNSCQQLTGDLINRYGTTPDNLLVTTTKKLVK